MKELSMSARIEDASVGWGIRAPMEKTAMVRRGCYFDSLLVDLEVCILMGERG